jgi:dipeptidyl aminopeptidase/acylaminoacyl peptidase
MWMGALPNAEEVAKSVSPLTYVRPGLPPIISIHGDKDSVVPYSHSVSLHEALKKTKNIEQLVTIEGGDHGMFTKEQSTKGYDAIWKFLGENKIGQ